MQREHRVQSRTGVCQESKTCPCDFHDGGYFTFNNGQAVAHYYIQDHQGNIRAVVDSENHVEQINHYYPFGAVYSDAGFNDALQRYKYNGKELDRMHGLNQYDYGARNYDPLLCRFTQVDPLCEKYYSISPYAYCANNPANIFDPDGRDYYYTSNGQFIRKDDKETMNILIGTDDDGYNLLKVNGKAIQYDDFVMYASTVYGESSAYRQKEIDEELKHETYAIASVFARNNRAYGKYSNAAKIFRGIDDEGRNKDSRMQAAIAATINAMTGGYYFKI